MNNNNIGINGYVWKYIHALGIENFKVGFKYDAEGNICVIDLTPAEFVQYSHCYFEYVSEANKRYRKEVLGIKVRKDKKHLRCGFKPMELKNLWAAKYGYEPCDVKGEGHWFTIDEFKAAKKVVGALKNQDNAGYAVEFLILGEDWNDKKKGIYIDETRTEIKFQNGQIELYKAIKPEENED